MTHHAAFVRLALPAEAYDIAALQFAAMSDPGHPAHALVAQTSVDEIAAVWHQAITRPPLAECRVLVATDAGDVVGMVCVTPSPDEDAATTDGQIAEFLVSPPARGRGHGSRLVQAAVDTLRADGFDRVTWWLPTTHDDLRSWLVDLGFGPDGGHVEVGTEDGSLRVKLVRLHADISSTASDRPSGTHG